MRVRYPELVYGSISSSGVVQATIDDWLYMDIIRQVAPENCVSVLIEAVKELDDVLLSSDTNAHQTLKSFYGLANVSHNTDVASILNVRSSSSFLRYDHAGRALTSCLNLRSIRIL